MSYRPDSEPLPSLKGLIDVFRASLTVRHTKPEAITTFAGTARPAPWAPSRATFEVKVKINEDGPFDSNNWDQGDRIHTVVRAVAVHTAMVLHGSAYVRREGTGVFTIDPNFSVASYYGWNSDSQSVDRVTADLIGGVDVKPEEDFFIKTRPTVDRLLYLRNYLDYQSQQEQPDGEEFTYGTESGIWNSFLYVKPWSPRDWQNLIAFALLMDRFNLEEKFNIPEEQQQVAGLVLEHARENRVNIGDSRELQRIITARMGTTRPLVVTITPS